MTENVMAEAPAPGSPEKTSVLAVGARGDWVPSPATRHGVQGGKSFFCDVHRTKKNGGGYRIIFTTDGVTFRHVDSFLDIPADVGDKVFVDVLPLHHTDGVIELLRRGVEVYYLRRLTLVAKRREELKLSKSSRSDIKVLMSLEEKWFRRVSEDFLVMRRMIAAYRSLMRIHIQLTNKSKALSEHERDMLKPVIRAVEEQMETVAEKISDEAGRRYPAYNRLIEELGICGNANAMEALAEVLVFPEWRSWRRTRSYFGMWPRDRRTYFHRSKPARRALERLTMSIKGYNIKAGDLEDTLKTVWLAQKAGTPPA